MKRFKLPLVAIPPVVSGILSVSLISTVLLFFVTAGSEANHLPALSEAALYIPGKYVFTLSIVISGFLLSIMAFVLYYALCQRTYKIERMMMMTMVTMVHGSSRVNGSGGGSGVRSFGEDEQQDGHHRLHDEDDTSDHYEDTGSGGGGGGGGGVDHYINGNYNNDHHHDHHAAVEEQHSSRAIMCCFGCFRLRWLNIVSCLFVLVSSVGLIGLGLVPLVEGDPTQLKDISSGTVDPELTNPWVTLFHLSCSGIFFMTMYAHMWLNLIGSFWMDRKLSVTGGQVRSFSRTVGSSSSSSSWAWRKLGVSTWTLYRFACCLLVIASIVFIQFVYLILMITRCSLQDLEQKKTCEAIELSSKYGAVTQYAMIAWIILYMVSYVYEMRGLHVHVKLDDPAHDASIEQQLHEQQQRELQSPVNQDGNEGEEVMHDHDIVMEEKSTDEL